MIRFRIHSFAWALVATLVVTSPLLAQRGQRDRRFAETVEVVTVEVPVEVLHDGEPVRGLSAENFEIYDGRKRQTITGFEVVDLAQDGGRALDLADLSVSARRHFLILFDLGFSDPSVISRARRSALDLIEQKFHPTDLVAVATYTQQSGPQLILGFTPDRHQVHLAIETLGLTQLVERASDPLAFVLADSLTTRPSSEGTETGAGGAGLIIADAIFAEAAADYAVGFDRAQRGEQQGRVLALTTDLQNLARALDEVEGRKHVVYLSEGFDASVILGSSDQARSGEVAAAAASGEYWRVDSEERFGSTGAMGALEAMLEEFRRADCTIHTVDIGGLRAGDQARARSSGQDSLYLMANKTGGELYRNFNDLGGAMAKMLERTSVTYLLAFQPTDLESDGGYHRLRVQLKDGPRGAKVVHRPGYYAPRPYSERGAIERRFDAANKVLASGGTGVLTTAVVAAPFRDDTATAYVPILIEIDGPTLLAGLSGAAAGIEIYAYAIAEDGTVGDYMAQTMALDLSQVRPALEASGLKFFGDMELVPGEYQLRVLVRDSETGRSSTQVMALSVPSRAAGTPTLAMPLFPETPGKWLMVQEATGRTTRTDRPYPFLLGENPYIPAAKPVLPRNGSTQFVVLGYDLDGDAVPLETQVVAADGSPVEGPKISLVSRGPGANPDSTQFVLQLETNRLPVGEYMLVARLGKTKSTSIPFRVAGS